MNSQILSQAINDDRFWQVLQIPLVLTLKVFLVLLYGSENCIYKVYYTYQEQQTDEMEELSKYLFWKRTETGRHTRMLTHSLTIGHTYASRRLLSYVWKITVSACVDQKESLVMPSWKISFFN